MKKRLTSLVLGLCLTVGTVVTVYAATCSTKVTTKDGQTVEVTLEGSACTWDLNTGICACV